MEVKNALVFFVIGFFVVFSAGVFAQSQSQPQRADPSGVSRADDARTGNADVENFDSNIGVERSERIESFTDSAGVEREVEITEEGITGADFSERRVMFRNENGESVVIRHRLEKSEGGDEEVSIFSVGGVEVKSELGLEEDFKEGRSRIIAMTRSGEEREIKVMPNRASITAVKTLGSLGFQLQIREVDENTGRIAYVAESRRQARLFGIFRIDYTAKAVIDVESGEVTNIDKPIWEGLADVSSVPSDSV